MELSDEELAAKIKEAIDINDAEHALKEAGLVANRDKILNESREKGEKVKTLLSSFEDYQAKQALEKEEAEQAKLLQDGLKVNIVN